MKRGRGRTVIKLVKSALSCWRSNDKGGMEGGYRW